MEGTIARLEEKFDLQHSRLDDLLSDLLSTPGVKPKLPVSRGTVAPTKDGNTDAGNVFGVGLGSETNLAVTDVNQDDGPAMEVRGVTDSVETVVNAVVGEAVPMEGDAYDIVDNTITDQGNRKFNDKSDQVKCGLTNHKCAVILF